MEKTNVEGLYRKEPGVFVNTADDKLKAYQIRKQQARELKAKMDKVDELDERLDKIQSSLDSLTKILIQQSEQKDG